MNHFWDPTVRITQAAISGNSSWICDNSDIAPAIEGL